MKCGNRRGRVQSTECNEPGRALKGSASLKDGIKCHSNNSSNSLEIEEMNMSNQTVKLIKQTKYLKNLNQSGKGLRFRAPTIRHSIEIVRAI